VQKKEVTFLQEVHNFSKTVDGEEEVEKEEGDT
jgi:hypothetical protein